MANRNSVVNVNDGTSVSNTSPQSPTALLETPITLGFDPMSFQFKDDSPLTSPDSGRDIGEMLSPSQNADVVEFFDPFCPVKEESPTDYYPNVMLGQTTLAEPPLDTLSEQQYSNGFTMYDDVHDDTIVNDSYQDDICEVMSEIRNEADDICEMSSEIRDEDICEMSSEIRNEDEDVCEMSSEIRNEDEDVCEMSSEIRNEDEDVCEMSSEIRNKEEDVYEISSEIKQEEDNVCEVSLVITDNDNEVANRSDALEKPEELLADVYPSSDLSTVVISKSETSTDVELITELEQTQSEEACVSSVTEQEFDDNKHDTNSQHEQ
ncbi:hypothetical protein X975_12675, partial [Stegodyphus mimosarum]